MGDRRPADDLFDGGLVPASDAFISTSVHPYSSASARAVDVFHTGGPPARPPGGTDARSPCVGPRPQLGPTLAPADDVVQSMGTVSLRERETRRSAIGHRPEDPSGAF